MLYVQRQEVNDIPTPSLPHTDYVRIAINYGIRLIECWIGPIHLMKFPILPKQVHNTRGKWLSSLPRGLAFKQEQRIQLIPYSELCPVIEKFG